MAKVIAICNQKGGTGKTTTAINLATYLALVGEKTLLIDIDPQGNATSGLGIKKNNLDESIYDLLLGHIEVEGVIMPTEVDNLELIPSNISLTGAEVELVEVEKREHRLYSGIEKVISTYSYIFIDSPPSLGLLTLNALTAADSTLIPLQCEYYALEGISQLLQTVDLVKKNLNPRLEIEGVLLTMVDYRTNLSQEVIEEARAYFKDKVYKTVIPRNVRLSEAPGFGKPIALYDRDSSGGQSYLSLSQELLGML